MRKLFEADLNRIIEKVLPWVLLVGAFVYMAVSIAIEIETSPDRDFFFFSQVVGTFPWVLTIAGFSALLGIYADEFKSMSMITVIGRGISREKFVLTKFLDLCLMVFQMEVLTAIYIMILKGAFGTRLTFVETKYLVLLFVFGYIETVSYVTIAAIFYFLSENAAIGMFAYLTFDVVIPVTLQLVLMLSNVSKYHPDRYYISGMIDIAFSDFIMGDIPGGMVFTFLALGIYVLCALLITTLIFRKKELNF